MKYILLLFSCLTFGIGAAQHTVAGDTAYISEEKIRGVGSAAQNTWKTSEQQAVRIQNIGQFLSENAAVYIRNYGPSTLATASIRGGSTGHTMVLWNGLPLQSPTLGLLDLSLVNTQGFSSISLKKGSNAAAYGSGAVGGLISLNNDDFSAGEKFQLQLATGSFGLRKGSLGAKLSIGNVTSRTDVFYATALNDFPLVSTANPDDLQSNAEARNLNIQQSFEIPIGKRNTLQLFYWRIATERQIPPLLTQNGSIAYQEDDINRYMLKWKTVLPNAVFNARLAYFDEHNNYFDGGLTPENNFTSAIGELTLDFHLGERNKLQLGVANYHTQATTDGYLEGVTENRPSAFLVNRLGWWRLNLTTTLRQEFLSRAVQPFIPQFRLDFDVFNNLNFYGEVGRTFRNPTLNDRFWQPGGNADLRPEIGWSQEIGQQWKYSYGRFTLDWQLAFFSRRINDFILWSRLDRQPFWSANNITEVWSRGYEPTLGLEYLSNYGKHKLQVAYAKVLSTNEVALSAPKIPVGQQLFYVPENQLALNYSYSFRKFTLQYNHQWLGSTLGINEMVEAASVGQLILETSFSIGDQEIGIAASANNLFDSTYFLTERRPMPGRNFEFSLQYKI